MDVSICGGEVKRCLVRVRFVLRQDAAAEREESQLGRAQQDRSLTRPRPIGAQLGRLCQLSRMTAQVFSLVFLEKSGKKGKQIGVGRNDG